MFFFGTVIKRKESHLLLLSSFYLSNNTVRCSTPHSAYRRAVKVAEDGGDKNRVKLFRQDAEFLLCLARNKKKYTSNGPNPTINCYLDIRM